MKCLVLSGVLFFSTALFAAAQEPRSTPTPEPAKTTPAKTGEPDSPPTAPPLSQPNAYVRPDAKKRFNRYVNSVVGPFAIARQLAGAGISTWRNSPVEWGGQWEGFGRRVASNFGKNTIKQTTIYGLDEAFRLDSHFYRSKNKSVGKRITNALISPVTARKPDGKRVIGFPRLIGTYSASIIAAETWYPSRFDYKDGLKNGTISLGFNAAFNLVKEFIWKK